MLLSGGEKRERTVTALSSRLQYGENALDLHHLLSTPQLAFKAPSALVPLDQLYSTVEEQAAKPKGGPVFNQAQQFTQNSSAFLALSVSVPLRPPLRQTGYSPTDLSMPQIQVQPSPPLTPTRYLPQPNLLTIDDEFEEGPFGFESITHQPLHIEDLSALVTGDPQTWDTRAPFLSDRTPEQLTPSTQKIPRKEQLQATRRSERLRLKQTDRQMETQPRKKAKGKTKKLDFNFDQNSHLSALYASSILQILQATGLEISDQVQQMIEEAATKDKAVEPVDPPLPTTPIYDVIPPLSLSGVDMLL